MSKYIKHWLFILMILSASQSFSQQNFYVYQHDGTINTFSTMEIDSITVSTLGIDGIEYENNVTQLYWTKDSVYQIPIEAIDSVGFVTPQTVLQQNVINIADCLYPYILSCDSLTIFLSSSTPKDILPKENELLVYMESSDIFPNAFAGKVVDVRTTNVNTVLECTLVELTEIFKCYYSTTTHTNNGNARLKRSSENAIVNEYILDSPPATTIDLLPLVNGVGYTPNWPDGIFSINGNANLDVTVATQNKVTVTLIVRDDHPTTPVSINTKFTSSFNLSEDIGLAGTLKWDKDFVAGAAIPTAIPFFNFYVAIGPYIKGEVEISSATTLSQRFSINLEASMNGHGMLTSVPRIYLSDIGHSENTRIALKGSIGIGAFGEFGVCLIARNFARVNLRENVYFNLEGDCALYNSDIENAMTETTLYDHLKDSKVSANIVGELKLVGALANWEWNKDLIRPVKIPIHTWDVVPEFEERYQENSSNKNGVFIQAKQINNNNGFLLPVTLDMGVFDEDNENIMQSSDNDEYRGGTNNYYYVFDNLSKDKKYTAYPLVTFLGIQMRATPAIDVDFCPASITKVECTDARYITDDDNRAYPNRLYFDVTGNLDEMDGIDEWGIYFISYNSGEYYTFPFENISSSQTKSMRFSSDGSTMSIDYSSFVAEHDDQVGVYVKKHNENTGKQRTIYGSLFDYTLRYDTKPSITISNPYITSTEIIGSKTKTDNDGNMQIVNKFQTFCNMELKIEGTYWMNNITHGISGGNWEWPGEGWHPTVDYIYPEHSINPTYWEDSQTLNFSCWYAMHIRNTSKIINSNYLNWSGNGTITNVWTSSAPSYVPRRILSQQNDSDDLKNYVIESSLNDENKSIDKFKNIIPCNGGYIGVY